MRRLFGVLSLGVLVGCGVFGADEDPTTPAATPQDNAQPPPPVGAPAPPGIYVSASKGADDGSGTIERPIKTLKAGLAAAKAANLRLVVCAEEYREELVLLDGVSLAGYYDCSSPRWERGLKHAVLRSPSSPAVIARGLASELRIEGFDIFAPDADGSLPATDTTGTSIALEIRDTAKLTMGECLVHAGRAAHGQDGSEGALNARTAASNGAPATDQGPGVCGPNCTFRSVHGGEGGVTTCKIGPNGGAGGRGGDGQWYDTGAYAGATPEVRGLPVAATTTTGIGALNESGAAGTGHGLAAERAADGAEGKDGLNGAWLLTSVGFTRGNGQPGTAGGPGVGGGGGAGSRSVWSANGGQSSAPLGPTAPQYYQSATGGGGGGGGCAGQAGTPGTGGGASIGALVVKSGVTLEHVRIESSKGGRAGKGNLGTPGITGGTGGLGTSHGVPTTGKGGDGGAGGSGGASGHGAPGPSIALAFSGTRPTMTEVMLEPGEGGTGQPELTRFVGGKIGTKTLPAVVGQSAREVEIKL